MPYLPSRHCLYAFKSRIRNILELLTREIKHVTLCKKTEGIYISYAMLGFEDLEIGLRWLVKRSQVFGVRIDLLQISLFLILKMQFYGEGSELYVLCRLKCLRNKQTIIGSALSGFKETFWCLWKIYRTIFTGFNYIQFCYLYPLHKKKCLKM